MTTTPCSCGCAEAHVIAKRQTLDERRVEFWSDGTVTWAMGWRVRGAGVARYSCIRERNVRACWIVASLVDMYDAADVPMLVEAARREVSKPGHYDEGAIRRNVHASMEAAS